MKSASSGRLLRLVDEIFSAALLVAMLGIFAYGCYAIWDTNTVVTASLPGIYKKYKPEKKKGSLEGLQKQNKEVLGWLSVYNTGIDYPLVQARDNEKYLNRNVEGGYSLAGSIFLDFQNSPNFDDFNTIIYGHHMQYHAMFGDVSEFKDQKFFDSHPYGSIFYGGKQRGLEFFAFLEVDAYQTSLYVPAVAGEELRERYLRAIKEAAIWSRHLPVTTEDQIVLLSTCTTALTNGRHILVGKITDQVPDKPGEKENDRGVRSYVEANSDILSAWILVGSIGLTGGWILALRLRVIRREGEKGCCKRK